MKKYTFVKIKYKGFGDWGWWLKIENWLQLYDWYMEVQARIVGWGVLNFLASKEFHYLISDKPHKKNHYNTAYGQILLFEAKKQFALGKKVGLISLIEFLSKTLLEDKTKQLNKGIILYINKAGGYSPECKSFEEIDFVKKDECIFPECTENDIKILQWDGGKHWYAKLGGTDVVVDGKQKWKTYDQAKNSAIEFLKVL